VSKGTFLPFAPFTFILFFPARRTAFLAASAYVPVATSATLGTIPVVVLIISFVSFDTSFFFLPWRCACVLGTLSMGLSSILALSLGPTFAFVRPPSGLDALLSDPTDSPTEPISQEPVAMTSGFRRVRSKCFALLLSLLLVADAYVQSK
jgi:hypothetical protein